MGATLSFLSFFSVGRISCSIEVALSFFFDFFFNVPSFDRKYHAVGLVKRYTTVCGTRTPSNVDVFLPTALSHKTLNNPDNNPSDASCSVKELNSDSIIAYNIKKQNFFLKNKKCWRKKKKV